MPEKPPPVRIVLRDVNGHVPHADGVAPLRRGDILEATDERLPLIPLDLLSRELPPEPVYFLLEKFSIQGVHIIRAGPPGEERSPEEFPRTELDVYGQILNEDKYHTVVLRRREPLFERA